MSVCTEVSSNCTVAGFHLTLDSFSVKRQFIANFHGKWPGTNVSDPVFAGWPTNGLNNLQLSSYPDWLGLDRHLIFLPIFSCLVSSFTFITPSVVPPQGFRILKRWVLSSGKINVNACPLVVCQFWSTCSPLLVKPPITSLPCLSDTSTARCKSSAINAFAPKPTLSPSPVKIAETYSLL